MEKTVLIDGKEVKFRATAAIPRLYRIQFRRDIMQDMARLQKDIQKAKSSKKGSLPLDTLTIFENIAFLMAKHANPNMPEKKVGEWLDGFQTFSIYAVFPQIFELWKENLLTLVQSKKKHVPPSGK